METAAVSNLFYLINSSLHNGLLLFTRGLCCSFWESPHLESLLGLQFLPATVVLWAYFEFNGFLPYFIPRNYVSTEKTQEQYKSSLQFFPVSIFFPRVASSRSQPYSQCQTDNGQTQIFGSSNQKNKFLSRKHHAASHGMHPIVCSLLFTLIVKRQHRYLYWQLRSRQEGLV